MLFIIFLVWSFWYSDARYSPSKNPAVAPTSRDHSQRRYCFLTILCTKFPTNHNRLRHISVLFQFVYYVLTCYTKISFSYLLFNHTPGFIFFPKVHGSFFFYLFVGLMLLSVLWIGSRVTLRGWFLRARRRGPYVFQFIIILFMSKNCRLMLILSLLLKFIYLWPFFRFEHHIRPEHVLPSAAGHDSDDDDFMPIPNTRSSSHIDKSKDVGPRKTRQTRAGLSTGACTEVYTIYLLLHFLFIRVIILKLLFVCITSLFFPSIYHKSTIMSLLPNLYFSISVLLSTTPAIFFSTTLPLH